MILRRLAPAWAYICFARMHIIWGDAIVAAGADRFVSSIIARGSERPSAENCQTSKILAAIVDGTAPGGLTVAGLAKALPYSWVEQEETIGFSS